MKIKTYDMETTVKQNPIPAFKPESETVNPYRRIGQLEYKVESAKKELNVLLSVIEFCPTENIKGQISIILKHLSL